MSGFFFLPSLIESCFLAWFTPNPVDMRRILLVFAIVCFGYAAQAQKPMSIKIKDPIICYAGTEDHPHYVAPRGEKSKIKALQEADSADIAVNYIGFDGVPQAKAAFQKAVNIWRSLLVTDVPIHIEARWVALAAGVLGSANYTAAYANFKGAQRINVFYPVALAEKITGNNLNGDNPDLFANFNSNFNWHFDPDDPDMEAGQYDLTTVVLHEIGHGLGFSGTFTNSSNQGSFGLLGTGVPVVYDAFIQNSAEANLIETFPSPSTSLSGQLLSGTLFFDGHSGTNKIYAPNPFNGGSSISHLDEATFNETANALMTPQVASQERIRDPGIALEILKDLGWDMVFIDHNKLGDTENIVGPYLVTATIDSDNGYDPATVTLHHTLDGINFTDVIMTPMGNDVFIAPIPSQGDERQYGYFISVENNAGAVFVNPGIQVRILSPQQQLLNVFATGPDTEKPIITHTKELYLLKSETELIINAEISDNSGSLEAILEYSINDEEQDDITMTLLAPEEDSIYTATINFFGLLNGDEIKYRIIATDNSSNHNQRISPAEGEHIVPIIGFEPAQISYQNTFSDPERNQEFFGTGFTISTPTGFDNPALHSEHPYLSGNGFANNEREIIYQLRIPITVQDGSMSFYEIALVEPGNPGSVFGDDDFFDYVIVEGSDDEGETWQPLLDGYDARTYSVWLTQYNNAIDGDGNSTALAMPELYRKRTINLQGTFDTGTQIIIRFRMYIDQLASGWGWAIDNLAIQSIITETENMLGSKLRVYPNPITEMVHVEVSNPSRAVISIQLLNSKGQEIYKAIETALDESVSHTIATGHLAAGMYLVKISNGSESVVRKVIKGG